MDVSAETKGKTVTSLAISHLAPDSVYSRSKDLVAADSGGVVAIVAWGQILERISIGCAVTCLEIHREMSMCAFG
jgi:hypothetical protein